MCGRFEVFTYEEVAAIVAAVEGRTDKPLSATVDPRPHARPGSPVLLFGRRADADEFEIGEATWGFQPEWGTKPVFNTRIESALGGSGMWREPIQNGRCIIPAAAFYEPHATEISRSARTGRPIKRQYRFSLPSEEPLLLAGVQEAGHCSVVTCAPNRWVSPVHDRMPLVLRFEEVPTWLSPDWPALADRSDVELQAAPETQGKSESDQLTLF